MKRILSEVKEAFDAVSPYIQRHTSEVCPLCPKACCINRHSYYDKEDLVFIRTLGFDEAEYKTDRADTEPCRFLLEDGCSLPRYRRPFRCTWYFCERLLDSMRNDKPKDYRFFISAFENLQRLRRRLLDINGV